MTTYRIYTILTVKRGDGTITVVWVLFCEQEVGNWFGLRARWMSDTVVVKKQEPECSGYVAQKVALHRQSLTLPRGIDGKKVRIQKPTASLMTDKASQI